MQNNINLDQLCKKHDLKFIVLHGSQVTGKTHAKSDIDIAVMPKEKFDLLSLQADLSQKLKSDFVDLTNLLHANPLLAFTVASLFPIEFSFKRVDDNSGIRCVQ